MTDDLRSRLADARLYLCTDARRSRGDLVPFLDAVLGAGVDIIQLREKGLEAQEELGLLEVFAYAGRRHRPLLAVHARPHGALPAGAPNRPARPPDFPVSGDAARLGPPPVSREGPPTPPPAGP